MDPTPFSLPAGALRAPAAIGAVDHAPPPFAALERQIHLINDSVLYWQESAELTVRSIDERFRRFAALTAELVDVGWVWDIGELKPPPPAVLHHFRNRAAEIAQRTRHLAIRSGANIGLWLSLRQLLPDAGFRDISVHRSVATALERARRG